MIMPYISLHVDIEICAVRLWDEHVLLSRYLLIPPTGCSRADTLLNVHFVLFFTVFSASRQCCPGGGRGGAGTTVSSNDAFCLCPFALVFTVFFALSHSCFFAPSAFSLGFYSVFRLHDVADATPRWGGGGC